MKSLEQVTDRDLKYQSFGTLIFFDEAISNKAKSGSWPVVSCKCIGTKGMTSSKAGHREWCKVIELKKF